MITDNIIARGQFSLLVIDAKSGKTIEEYSDKNLVVGIGKTNVAKLLGGDVTGLPITKISVGTNATDPADGNTTITDSFVKDIDSVSYPDGNSVQFLWELLDTEANGKTITEFGLLNSAGALFARKTRTAIVKTSSVRLIGIWKIFIN